MTLAFASHKQQRESTMTPATSALGFRRTRAERSVLAAFALSLLVVTGCATSQLGLPPTAADLENDGSEQEKKARYREYHLLYDGTAYVRPGARANKLAGIPILPRALPETDSAREYISSSEPARAIYEGPLLQTHRFLGNQDLYVYANLGLFGVGAATGAIAGVLLTASESGPDATPPPIGFFLGGIIGGAVSVAAGTLCLGAGYCLARPVVGILAKADYLRASIAFNDDLRDRIEQQQRRHREPPPPSSAVPPIGEEPPAPPEPLAPEPLEWGAPPTAY